jgi:hypothetical protein
MNNYHFGRTDYFQIVFILKWFNTYKKLPKRYWEFPCTLHLAPQLSVLQSALSNPETDFASKQVLMRYGLELSYLGFISFYRHSLLFVYCSKKFYLLYKILRKQYSQNTQPFHHKEALSTVLPLHQD